MEDEKLKEIFSDFSPELPSSARFMARLQKNLETIDMLRQQNVALRRNYRLAVCVAALCGFVTGVIMTLLFPYISATISGICFSLLHLPYEQMALAPNLIAWILIAVISVITAMNTFEIVMAKVPAQSK